MNKKKILTMWFPGFFGLIVVCLMAAGCARGPQPGEVTRTDDAAPPPVRDTPSDPAPRAEPLPGVPEDWSQVITVRRHHLTPGHPVALEVTLENLLRDRPLMLELSTRFSDAQGGWLEDTLWAPVTIPAGGTHHYVARSANRRAANGVLRIRLAEADDVAR